MFKGFLHGAYFSGVRAADEIRDLFGADVASDD